ncbi:MAG: hypothetical protein CMF59_15140 [Leptospiraceae bacterium]|nr:hypothetical protein [Leptospiraceae bacterium]|tara:strand:- start:19 stop:666 length:648 start_codon:yes stop_codon:yes gene_type:complete
MNWKADELRPGSILALSCAVLLLLCGTGCIAWSSTLERESPAELDAASVRSGINLTVSYGARGRAEANVVSFTREHQMKRFSELLTPALQKLQNKHGFSSAEFSGLGPRLQGHHFAIDFEEDRPAWSIAAATLSSFSAAIVPTYFHSTYYFRIAYFVDGQRKAMYSYERRFHSANWILFLPYWLGNSDDEVRQAMHTSLLDDFVQDLLRDGHLPR